MEGLVPERETERKARPKLSGSTGNEISANPVRPYWSIGQFAAA